MQKLFVLNLPLNSSCMQDASFNYLNVSGIEGNLSCSGVLHQLQVTRCAHKLHSHTGRLLINLPENTANSQRRRVVRFTATEAFTVAPLWYYITQMSLFFMPCILQRSLKQPTNSSCNLSLEIFIVLKHFSLFQASLGWDAGHVIALRHGAASLYPWRQAKAIRTWPWGTGFRWPCLSSGFGADDLQKLFPTSAFCDCLFFLQVCNVHLGKVWWQIRRDLNMWCI